MTTVKITGGYLEYEASGGGGGGGQPPLGTWGGAGEPFPTPPIPVYPGGSPNPPGIWGGAIDPYPSHPIFYPPNTGPTPPPKNVYVPPKFCGEN